MELGVVRRIGRSTIGSTLLLVLAANLVILAGTAAPAAATTFSNTATITLPDPNCTDPDAGVPYPSTIPVSGLSGTVADVNVTLHGVTHAFEGDIEAMLVGPGGGSQNLEILSDAGTGALSNATVTFDDAAAAKAPQNSAWLPGTYKPTNYTELSGADTFPAPAPAPSASTTLAAFNGINPNGTWSLFVTDDACADAGSIGGGWSLDITMSAGVTTSTSVVSSLNPSRTGQSVTFTASVLSSGSPVTTGTVTFTDGGTPLGPDVALDASGQAAFSTSSLTEGSHVVTATYNGTPSFATSNGSVNQRVDNNTTVTGNTYCNTGPVTINDNGPATPYPSNIFVTGAANHLDNVTVTLKGVSHTFDGDVEALLVGPAGENLEIVSDAGTAAINNLTVTLDDSAAAFLPQSGSWAAPNSTLSAKPTNYTELSADTFPAPAPAPSAATTLGTFDGTNPNSTWSLYVKDDGAPDTGSIAGGWCLNIEATTRPVATDFDHDFDTDVSVFRPSNGVWYMQGGPGMTWGTSGDIPVPADYDGDGRTDIAVFRPSEGNWFFPNGSIEPFGVSGDVPVPADYDGDGKADIAVFRPSTATWYVKDGIAVVFGTTGDVPTVGNYDGDGDADIAVFRPSGGQWFVRNGPALAWGTSGDIPAPADYDHNGTTDIAVFRPATGAWYVQGGPALTWGTSGDIPVPGDYNGDGRAHIAVFRPSTGAWYVEGGIAVTFGISGDQPLPIPSAIRSAFF